jgi:hypothetical protein
MSDPTKPSFWRNIPISIKLVIALNVYNDVTGELAEEILAPMRKRWKDTDQKVAGFVADANRLKKAIGLRDATGIMRNVDLKGRTDAVDRAAAWLVLVKNVASGLANRTAPEDVGLARLGTGLEALLGDATPEMAFHEVLHVMPVALQLVTENASLLVGNGMLEEEIAMGDALLDEVATDAGLANTGLGRQTRLTDDLEALLGRIVTFFMEWADHRQTVETWSKVKLPGFDLSAAEQWIATRASAIQARQDAAKAKLAESTTSTTTPAPATPADPAATAVIADALAAFRSQGPTGEAT